jgi:hypothetical protein
MPAACHILEPRPTDAVDEDEKPPSTLTSHAPHPHSAFDNSLDPPLIKSRTLPIHKPGWS